MKVSNHNLRLSFAGMAFFGMIGNAHAANISFCSWVSSIISPSEKNCASVMPKPSQILSRVETEGVVLRLKIFATVDCERPDAIARRYSVHYRSSISCRIRAFASIAHHLLSIFFIHLRDDKVG